jgi:Heavy metal binding domain
MKPKIHFAVLTILLVMPAYAHESAHGKKGTKPVTLTGEVIDLTCFMQHPASAVGIDHAKCAKTCINKGLPVGFLADDGTVFLLIGTGHDSIASRVADMTGKKQTIIGTVVDRNGMKAIQLASLASAGVYTCAMHPEIRQNSPGSCPKCGMSLQPVTDAKK